MVHIYIHQLLNNVPPLEVYKALFLCFLILKILLFFLFFFRVVDVGSEWRTFSNEANGTDRSRVGGGEVIYVIRF